MGTAAALTRQCTPVCGYGKHCWQAGALTWPHRQTPCGMALDSRLHTSPIQTPAQNHGLAQLINTGARQPVAPLGQEGQATGQQQQASAGAAREARQLFRQSLSAAVRKQISAATPAEAQAQGSAGR